MFSSLENISEKQQLREKKEVKSFSWDHLVDSAHVR